MKVYVVESSEGARLVKTEDEALALAENGDGISVLEIKNITDAFISLMNDGNFEAKRKIIREIKE